MLKGTNFARIDWLAHSLPTSHQQRCLPSLFAEDRYVDLAARVLFANHFEGRTHADASVVVELVAGLKNHLN